jgi:hypothetical protein
MRIFIEIVSFGDLKMEKFFRGVEDEGKSFSKKGLGMR